MDLRGMDMVVASFLFRNSGYALHGIESAGCDEK